MNNVHKFSSGMSRRGDFGPTLFFGHSIGIDIQEMSSAAMVDFGRAFASSDAHLFVDSGAFSHFRATLRGKARGPIDFKRIFDKYDELARAICSATDDGGDEAMWRVRMVMPDVVGDQAATIALWREHADEIRAFVDFSIAIVPLQAGELTLAELYATACEIFGRGGLIVGIPSAVQAASNVEVTELLAAHGHEIDSVHILGSSKGAKFDARMAAIEAGGYDGPITADANRIQALWRPSRGVSRKAAMALLIGVPETHLELAA